MMGQKNLFVQAAFYCTPIYARVLVRPIKSCVEAPEARSWREVNDELLRTIPSTTLLHLVSVQLTREMSTIALENINGWVLHATRAAKARDALMKAAERFVMIRDGVFKTELTAALKALLVRKPLYKSCLSDKESFDEAVRDIIDRTLATVRFHWEIGLYANADARALAVRALSLLHATLAERVVMYTNERSIMMPARFKFYRELYDRLGQFRGIDARVNQAVDALSCAVALFPTDGRALYGSALDQFWSICTDLIDSLIGQLQDDFGQDMSVFEDFDDQMDVFENDTMDTLVVLDQIDACNCKIDMRQILDNL